MRAAAEVGSLIAASSPVGNGAAARFDSRSEGFPWRRLPYPLGEPMTLVQLGLDLDALLERQVAPGDHAQDAVRGHHRQMPEVALVHKPDGLDHGSAGLDGLRVARHHLAQRSSLGLEAGGHHAHQEVALGENPEEPILLADQNAAAAALGHPLGRADDRLVALAAKDLATL